MQKTHLGFGGIWFVGRVVLYVSAWIRQLWVLFNCFKNALLQYSVQIICVHEASGDVISGLVIRVNVL